MTLEQRVKALKKIERELPGELERIARESTMRAVEEAADKTPPTGDDLKGTNTRTGAMKQSWETASKVEPRKQGGDYVTELNNDQEYSSYVNDGHRLDRHFVPGLVLNPYSGMLEYNPDKKGGIVVGTRTAYIPGKFMVESAKEKYAETAQKELRKLVKKIK